MPIGEALDRLETIYGRPRMINRFTPMDELISCILSQHSSDASSFPAFTNLVSNTSGWAEIESMPVAALADLIRGAGLANQKAKNIQGTLRMIRERHGEYTLEPLRAISTEAAREWLESMPGVGPKTASIVLCFAMGRDAIPVDTHVFRVSWRLGVIYEEIGEQKAHDELRQIVPAEDCFRYHTTLIQHGRNLCRAPIPDCELCPLHDVCWWRRHGGPEKRVRELAKARRAVR